MRVRGSLHHWIYQQEDVPQPPQSIFYRARHPLGANGLDDSRALNDVSFLRCSFSFILTLM